MAAPLRGLPCLRPWGRTPPLEILATPLVHDTPSDIANAFNKHFASIAYRYQINLDNAADIDLNSMCDFVDSKTSENHSDFNIPPFCESDVLKAFQSIDTSKGTGLDGLSPNLLKIAAHIVSQPLTRILIYAYINFNFQTFEKLPE